ncbi:hypothetical protein QE152_g10959 [Popillia japonica]|uniref:Uncharacterized protein n=1 Tax=Popillia japonica TaxID=7064 RepID=A0AAW1LNJ3_POPJA
MELKEIRLSIFYGKQFETLSAALDAIENEKSTKPEIDVVISPPDVDDQTDEEAFDDDDLVTTEMPNDVPGQIKIEMDESEDDENWEYDDNILLSVLSERQKKKRKMAERKWTRTRVNMDIKGTSGAKGRFD